MLIKFDDSFKSAGTFTFYSDPGHGWLKVPVALLEKIGIADKVSTYSYMFGEHAYLEEDCDFSLFRRAIGAHGMNFRIKDKTCNNRSSIREYPHYSYLHYLNMARGTIGERIEFGKQSYVIKCDLGARGFEVIHASGCSYRLTRRQFAAAQRVQL
jgi:hypothetical protein